MARRPARRQRGDRRLQGAGARPPGDEGRARRARRSRRRPASGSSARASFAALTGAPVLTDEFERDPARGAFPATAPPAHDPISHLELVRNADAYLIAPASANTHRQARPRAGRQPPDERRARRHLPGGRRARDEQPHVGAPGHAREPRDAARARGDGRRARRRRAGLQGRVRRGPPGRAAELLAAVEAVVGPPAPRPLDGLRVLVTAGGTREPIDACASSATARRGRMGFALAEEAADLGAEVTVLAANVDAAARPARDATSTSGPPRSCATPRSTQFGRADVLLMAAAVADFRPA